VNPMTTLTAPAPSANGHQPHIILPIWASRDGATEIAPEPAADQPATGVDKPASAATLKAVAPLIVVNGLAVYGQLAYALEHIAPTDWVLPARVALAIGFAAAVESVALYVGWHAHDALLLKSHATARNLRRWSFLIAATVAAMNYAHFAAKDMHPTAAACAFGLLSLLSPWMWGLHTRRAARLQLLKERKVDDGGAEFSSERRRAFPYRTWQARRWSIDHGITDPREAWVGYNAERRAKALERRIANTPTGPAAQPTPNVEPPTPSTPPANGLDAPKRPTRRRAQPSPSKSRRQPTRRPAHTPTPSRPTRPTEAEPSTPTIDAQPTVGAHPYAQPIEGLSELQQQRLGDLAHEFPGDLPGRDRVMAHMQAKGYEGWTSKGPAQKLIDLLRGQREPAQGGQPAPTEEAP
jgi:hypothetical protein